MLSLSSVTQRASPAVTNAALLVLGLAMVQLCRMGAVEADHFVYGFSTIAMSQALLYLAAGWVVLNNACNRWTLPLILVVALLCRLVCVFPDPFLSTDVYRYVWDGRVQAAGINPFRYIPADPHLQFLRDQTIYPNVNRRTYAHTIYPPGAQMIFLLVTRISESVVCMKLAMVAFEGLAVWALIRVLTGLDLSRERVLLYAWHPLLFWEVASSGHVDAAAVAFIALAMLYRVRERPAAAGVVLGLATLIKLYPIVLLPAFSKRRELRTPLSMAATVAAGYACYLSVGTRVLGFLPAYAAEEGLDSGSRYFLLTLARNLLHSQRIPTAVFYAGSAAILLGIAACAYTDKDARPLRAFRFSLAIAATLMLLFSSHYPWYYLWLLPFLCVVTYVPMLYFTTACFYLYTTALANPGPAMYYMFEWLYATFGVMLVWSLGKTYVARSRVVASPITQPDLELTSARNR